MAERSVLYAMDASRNERGAYLAAPVPIKLPAGHGRRLTKRAIRQFIPDHGRNLLALDSEGPQPHAKEHHIYPIPLKVKSLPAAVKIKGVLSPSHCRRLISLAKRKGLVCIERDRYGQASTTMACRLLPEDDELIYKRFAQKATELNAEIRRLSLTGIYEPVSVLRYGAAAWIRPHIDADYRVPDPSKLSCTIQLVPKIPLPAVF